IAQAYLPHYRRRDSPCGLPLLFGLLPIEELIWTQGLSGDRDQHVGIRRNYNGLPGPLLEVPSGMRHIVRIAPNSALHLFLHHASGEGLEAVDSWGRRKQEVPHLRTREDYSKQRRQPL